MNERYINDTWNKLSRSITACHMLHTVEWNIEVETCELHEEDFRLYFIDTEAQYDELQARLEQARELEYEWRATLSIHPIWTVMNACGVGVTIRTNGSKVYEEFDENMLFLVDENNEFIHWESDDDDKQSLLWSDVDDDDNREEIKVEVEMDEEEYYRVRNGLSLAQQSTNEFNLNQIDRFGMASDEEDNGEGGYDGDDDEVDDDMGPSQVQQGKLRESRYGFTRVPFDPDESSIEGDEHQVEEEVSDEECEEDFMRDFGASYLIDLNRERKRSPCSARWIAPTDFPIWLYGL